jgi:hypothetical protein
VAKPCLDAPLWPHALSLRHSLGRPTLAADGFLAARLPHPHPTLLCQPDRLEEGVTGPYQGPPLPCAAGAVRENGSRSILKLMHVSINADGCLHRSAFYQSGGNWRAFTHDGERPPGCTKSRPRIVGQPVGLNLTSDSNSLILFACLVPQEGFEPPTPSLRMMCSTS